VYRYLGRILISGSALTIGFHDIRMGSKATVEWILPKYGEPKVILDLSRINVIAVGQSHGFITLIDKRSGLLLHTFRAHSNAVHQLKTYKNKLISCGTDNNLNLWDVNQQPTTTLLKPVREYTCFDTYIEGNELYAINGQKIVGMSLEDDLDSVHLINFKAQKNTLKHTIITTINVLPVHEMVLLGTDSGEINICF